MDATPPNPQRVSAFWSFARDHVGWATLEGLFGQQQASAIEPPWMHLDEDASAATALVKEFVSAGQMVFSEDASLYSPQALPRRGDLVIVVDGEGNPRALAATLEVTQNDGAEGAGRMVSEKLQCLYPTAAPVVRGEDNKDQDNEE